ncbi:MAG TPA: hypothetical protein VM658_21030 [bacterium]|nr:hypothetical protein [bacterium]
MWLFILSCALAAPALAYHPLDGDDPSTVEYRHFEFEWGNDLFWPEGRAEEAAGYVSIKSGLYRGLELDTTLYYTSWIDADDQASGFGDSEFLLKYRFLGDGQEPNNLGIEFRSLLPSGEREKGLAGDKMVPALFLIGSLGQGDFRAIGNAGAIFNPDANDAMLYGLAGEWAASDELALVAQIYGEADLMASNDDNYMEAVLGAACSVADGITLSAGLGAGLTPATPDLRISLAVVAGW